MKEKNYNYVYAVVNFTQRLAYIGSRGSNKPPLEDPYMGSFKKGLKFFPNKKIILSEHVTRKEAYEAERKWQIKYISLIKYNLKEKMTMENMVNLLGLKILKKF